MKMFEVRVKQITWRLENDIFFSFLILQVKFLYAVLVKKSIRISIYRSDSVRSVGSARVYRYRSIKNETSAWDEREREDRKEKQNSRSVWKEPKVPNPHTATPDLDIFFLWYTRKNNNSRIPAQWEAFLSSV